MTTGAQSLFPSLAPNVLAEQIQDRGAEVALAVFRLAKNAMLHSMDNDAVTEAIARALEILVGFSREVGSAATVTFADDTIFVCGQLLRASRGVYESASELGRILGRVGVSEVAFEPGVTREGLYAFGQALADALGIPSAERPCSKPRSRRWPSARWSPRYSSARTTTTRFRPNAPSASTPPR